jgi:uncharacterized protein YjcR
MSKMSELAHDIEQLYVDGMSAKQIANALACPINLVTDWLVEQNIRPFEAWSAKAQQRLIEDLYNPYNTVNS